MEQRERNRQIGTGTCARCHGTGKLPIMLAPPPCEIECARTLQRYGAISEPDEPKEPVWVCHKHQRPMPILWTDEQRTRCLKELGHEVTLALSVSRPWDYLILHPPFKDVENRDWPTKYRGRIYIHRAKSKDRDGLRWLMRHRHELGLCELPGHIFTELGNLYSADLRMGAIVGEVDIVDCVTKSNSRWFFGRYGFVLANPEAYEKPIPCRGMPGPFKVPEAVASECRRIVGGA